MAKAAKRSKSPKRKSKRAKRPASPPPVKQLHSEAPAGLVEKLRELDAQADAYWAALPEISAEDRAEGDRALRIRDGLRPAEKPLAPSVPPPVAATSRKRRRKQPVRELVAAAIAELFPRGVDHLSTETITAAVNAHFGEHHRERGLRALGLAGDPETLEQAAKLEAWLKNKNNPCPHATRSTVSRATGRYD